MTPNYSALTGKLWLERGGVFVLAIFAEAVSLVPRGMRRA
jgi:hypothetical protein